MLEESVHMLSEVGQGDGDSEGSKKPEATAVSRPRSPGVGSQAALPPGGSLNLKRHQSELSECDFLHQGLQKLSINRA